MIWYRKLYIGEGIGKKASKVKWKIKHNAGQIDVYVVALAANKNNLMDIIPAVAMLQKYYPKKDMFIIGLARGYQEAVYMVSDIVQEVYENTGGTNVREYILERHNKDGGTWRL